MATTKLLATSHVSINRQSTPTTTIQKNETLTDVMYGGQSFTSMGTHYVWEDVGAIWIGGYDSSLLDNYSVTSYTLRLKALTVAPVGTVITAFKTPVSRNASANDIYNAIKNGTVLYTLPSLVSAGGEILITVTNKSDMKNIINNGIGIYKISTARYNIYGESDENNATYVEFVYTDTDTPPVVDITYPKSVSILADQPNTFTWSYSQEAGATQSHYDLQYSNDNGASWVTLANKVASTSQSRVISANTFSSGVYLWRVRAWTKSGTVVGDWSQASIIARTNPSTSGVTCDGKPKPRITWTASEQQAFQIKFGDYDTGAIYGTVKNYTIPQYFDDNVYALTMRTQNNMGTWSNWTNVIYVQITNTTGADIILSTWQADFAIKLVWESSGTYVTYYVYRNGVPIAKVTNKNYIDSFACGECEYTIRGVTSAGYYTMSNIAAENLQLPFDIISDVNDVDWKFLKHLSSNAVNRLYNSSEYVSYLRFDGRAYPVSAHTGEKTRKGEFSYSFINHKDATNIINLIGKTVILKDMRGNRIIGVMNDLPYNAGRIHDISFVIIETDYNEAVAYD